MVLPTVEGVNGHICDQTVSESTHSLIVHLS